MSRAGKVTRDVAELLERGGALEDGGELEAAVRELTGLVVRGIRLRTRHLRVLKDEAAWRDTTPAVALVELALSAVWMEMRGDARTFLRRARRQVDRVLEEEAGPRRTAPHLPLDDAGPLESGDPTPEEEVEELELRRVLLGAEGLSETERKIAKARATPGPKAPGRQIAREAGCIEKTEEVLTARLRKKLAPVVRKAGWWLP